MNHFLQAMHNTEECFFIINKSNYFSEIKLGRFLFCSIFLVQTIKKNFLLSMVVTFEHSFLKIKWNCVTFKIRRSPVFYIDIFKQHLLCSQMRLKKSLSNN